MLISFANLLRNKSIKHSHVTNKGRKRFLLVAILSNSEGRGGTSCLHSPEVSVLIFGQHDLSEILKGLKGLKIHSKMVHLNEIGNSHHADAVCLCFDF